MRLFVAVWPPPAVIDQLAGLDRPSLAGVRWTTKDQWHVTLRFLGTVDDVGAVNEALVGLAAVSAVERLGPVGPLGQVMERLGPVERVGPVGPLGPVGPVGPLGQVMERLGPVGPVGPLGPVERLGPVVARMGPVVERLGPSVLCLPVAGLDEVAEAVTARTASLGEPPGRPFRGHLTLARGPARRGADLRPLAGQPLYASWPVDEVTLVASALHPQGARYHVVGRFPLPGHP